MDELCLRFVLFNDTWSQLRHMMPCMTMLLSVLVITSSDIKTIQVTHKVGHRQLTSSTGVCLYIDGLTYPLYPLGYVSEHSGRTEGVVS